MSQSKANLLVDKHFRWRNGEMTRIEAFSDAVFAFAVTLLVVALEVPHTFCGAGQRDERLWRVCHLLRHAGHGSGTRT